MRDLSTQMNSWSNIGWSSYTVSPISDLLCPLTSYDTALLHLRRHFPSFFEVQELHRRYHAVRDYLEGHKKQLDVKTEPEWSMAFQFLTLVGELGHYGMELAETLQQITKAKEDASGPGQGGGPAGKKKMSKEEANVRARQLLCETPTVHWTTRKLAKQIPCSLAWIPYLPAWRAYHEKRKELTRKGAIKTVSLTSKMEAVLGAGDKDEVLQQLVAEQEGDAREDARQAKLYLSHEKKPRRRES